MDIIAKKTEDGRMQDLIQHTDSVLDYSFSLISDDVLEFASAYIGWNKQKMLDLIFLSAYFHDMGKATAEFQNTINNNKKSYHSLYSASLFTDVNYFNYGSENEINILFLVLLTHHSIFNKKSTYKSIGQNPNFNFIFLPGAKEFFYSYKNKYKYFFEKDCPYIFEFKPADLKTLRFYINGTSGLYKSVQRNKGYDECSKLKVLYSYVLGILNIADWQASCEFSNIHCSIQFKKKPDEDWLFNKLKESLGIEKFTPKDFQQKLLNTKGNVLVEIPTGEGKTEGSYLWALGNIKDSNSKVIYTLPTQTTSNKLYERACKIFQKNTGLIHGMSTYYLSKKYEEENGQVDDYFKSEILFNSVFCKPFTVSTIDSFLKYFINNGRFNIANFNFYNSVVIIDEIHSYDFKLLGFIKRLLELCAEFKVPVCIMSASMPDKIKEKLCLKDFTSIRDDILMEREANYIHKINGRLDDDLQSIVNKFNSGKNVLVVRNRISDSIRTYMKLNEILNPGKEFKDIENVMLYNSQFKKCDRIKKEQQIYKKLKDGEHFILVATQVVEISLDIDFDAMFTDNAPIDALIQRFGRVNRKKRPDKIGDIFIYKDTEVKPYYGYMLDLTFGTIQEGLFTIRTYNKWLNDVYDLVFDSIKIQNEISKNFDEGYEKYNETLNSSDSIAENDEFYEFRDISYPKNDFILANDYYKNNYGIDNTVSLPAWYRNSEHVCAKRDIVHGIYYDVLDFEYSYEIGVEIPHKDDISSFIIDD